MEFIMNCSIRNGFIMNYRKSKIRKILKWTLLEKIFKLTNQMIPKYWNWYININITTRGFQRDQNYQIPIYILNVIDPASQRLNSDWKWTVVGQTLNWGVKWSRNFITLLSTESGWNKESNETRIKWFLRSKRYSIFKISQNSNQNWVKFKNKMS